VASCSQAVHLVHLQLVKQHGCSVSSCCTATTWKRVQFFSCGQITCRHIHGTHKAHSTQRAKRTTWKQRTKALSVRDLCVLVTENALFPGTTYQKHGLTRAWCPAPHLKTVMNLAVYWPCATCCTTLGHTYKGATATTEMTVNLIPQTHCEPQGPPSTPTCYTTPKSRSKCLRTERHLTCGPLSTPLLSP
jgi:hypothetical protein